MASPFYAALASGPVTKRGRYELLRQSLLNERSSFDAHWRDLADFIMPRRVRFSMTDRNKGDKRNQNIIDSTGRYAARTLQSGLHAGLTSPARPWMKLSTPDPDLADFGPVKEWLHVVTQRMLTVFAQTNLYNVLPVVYGDMGIFGTAAMATLRDSRDLFRTFAYPVGSYSIAMNNRGVVDTFYREYEMTVRQVVQEFIATSTGLDWSKASPHIKNMWDRGDYEQPVQIGWMVQPNEDRNPRALDPGKRMPFLSSHFEIGGEGGQSGDSWSREDRFLRESGFLTFPIQAPRWDVTGEDNYGTDCPGMTALGDIRQLQGMQRKKGQLLAKAVDPPLKGPSSLRTQKTSLVQGDITYVDAREGQQGLSPIHEVRLEGFQHLSADIREVQYRIQRAFYEDLFLMLANSDPGRGMQPITAREVQERHEEKLLALGPVLERTNDELLDPLIDRSYAMMEDAGLIPDPPDELDQVQLKVEYVSIMAQAQKLVGVTGQDRFIMSVTPLTQFFPEVRHKIKAFRIVDNYADMLGIDPRQVRSDEEAQALADQEAQAQQQQAAAENAAKMGQAASGLSGTIEENSPLERVLGNVPATAGLAAPQ